MVTAEQVSKAASKRTAVASSDGKRVYTVELFVDGSASCTCMAYRYQKGPRANATCKHIRNAGHAVESELRVAGISFRKATEAPIMGWLLGR